MDFLLTTLLPFFAMLVGLIVLHELGHYFTAKWFGIKVLEAGLGFPPRAWGFTWHGTIYSVNWLPLGGFVRLLGEEDPSDPQSLAASAAWKRVIVLGSGAVINLALPIFLFAILYMIPQEVSPGPAHVGTVVTDSPAAEAGLQNGDEIIEIEGRSIKNVQEATKVIRLNQGEVDRLQSRAHGRPRRDLHARYPRTVALGPARNRTHGARRRDRQ